MGAQTGPSAERDGHASVAERLERGELVQFPACPFDLPAPADLDLLRQQRLAAPHKNVCLDPHSGRVTGYRPAHAPEPDRLASVLRSFGEAASTWLAGQLPRYAGGLTRDRVTLRPEEEATRRLRHNARNDLLHVDAFPSRPTQGARILRLFVNVNPADPRVWVTGDHFGQLFDRFAPVIGLQAEESAWPQRLLGLFDPGETRRSDYDRFMLRLHQAMKADDDFQERSRKRFLKFPPGSAWLAFTDALAHAELRGRCALEHSFFVPRACLTLPELAPAAVYERACGSEQRRVA